MHKNNNLDNCVDQNAAQLGYIFCPQYFLMVIEQWIVVIFSFLWIIPNKIVDNFEGKIDNLHRTDDGESGQQSHRATNGGHLILGFSHGVLGDSVKRWSVEIDSDDPQLILPFIFLERFLCNNVISNYNVILRNHLTFQSWWKLKNTFVYFIVRIQSRHKFLTSGKFSTYI